MSVNIFVCMLDHVGRFFSPWAFANCYPREGFPVQKVLREGAQTDGAAWRQDQQLHLIFLLQTLVASYCPKNYNNLVVLRGIGIDFHLLILGV